MSMEWVRRNYRVPARRGARVKYTGRGASECGTITSAGYGYIRVRLDGVGHSIPFHPTWCIEYLDNSEQEQKEMGK